MNPLYGFFSFSTSLVLRTPSVWKVARVTGLSEKAGLISSLSPIHVCTVFFVAMPSASLFTSACLRSFECSLSSILLNGYCYPGTLPARNAIVKL
jgi:hypothetical protein